MDELHVIFGTGTLGRHTATALLGMGYRVRLINRSGRMDSIPQGAELAAAHALDPDSTSPLLAGAATVYQCAQPPYNRWAAEFPALQQAVLDATAKAGARLVVAENLYMYGAPDGKLLKETTPYAPCSRKGQVRTEMTKRLFAAHEAGQVQVASIRGSDFFGPWEPVNGAMVFKAALAGKTVNLLGSLNQPHSFSYVVDFGRALAIAGTDKRTLGRAWHLPSGPAITQSQLVDLLSKALDRPVKAMAAGRLILSMLGLFNPGAREVVEMLYEFTAPFIIDASDMETTFGFTATPMEERISETLAWAKDWK
jgi:nucleoside-diphosphate-sugar epimerase